MATVVAAAEKNDSLRLLALFCALNTVSSVSLGMFVIARSWAMTRTLATQEAHLATLTTAVEHCDTSVEALLHSSSRERSLPKPNAPSTFRNFIGYLACNPRLLREVSFQPVEAGRSRLAIDRDFLSVWVDRFNEPQLPRIEMIFFIDRENPAITESTGRTLLRFAKVLHAARPRIGDPDFAKLDIRLAKGVDVHRSFFVVKRKAGKRVMESVLQYSRAIVENGGTVSDVEAVEEIVDHAEIAKFKRAAVLQMDGATPVAPGVLLSVFRDVLNADRFVPLKHAEWRERIDALLQGGLHSADSVIENSSEFTISNARYPWEVRAADGGPRTSRAAD